MGSQLDTARQAKMYRLCSTFLLSLSLLVRGEPQPGRNAVEEDINQLMNRFMFDDYESITPDYDYHQEQEQHFAGEAPSNPSPHGLQNLNHKRPSSQKATDQETQVTQQVEEDTKDPVTNAAKDNSESSVDPKLRDFTLIISKLLFHLSQL